MKLLIALTDQSFARTKSVGIFNVSMGLARGLMNCPEVSELHILGNEEFREAFPELPAHVTLHLMDRPVPRRFQRVWWDQVGIVKAIRCIAPDWAILPKGFPPFFPCLGKTRLACYVHDVIWEYYDKLSGNAESPFPVSQLIYFRALGKRALAVSDLVLTSTQFNAARFQAHVPSAKTAVVGIGFNEAPQPPASAGKDVLLHVSSFPHKLTHQAVPAVQAWLAQREDSAQIRVHVLGSLPADVQLPSEQWVRHQRIPYAELCRIIREESRMTLYFSDYEGFGMPPVESLLCGVPCLASDIPPIRENIPDQYLFTNGDVQDFIRKANAVYDGQLPFTCPQFPDWNTVALRCARALRAASN